MSEMWEYQPRTISKIHSAIADGSFALPTFQRDSVWSKEKEKELFVSLLRGRPTGSLLLLNYTEPDKKLFAVKNFAGGPEVMAESTQYLVLDGQQRMTAIYRAARIGWKVGRGYQRAVLKVSDLLAGEEGELATGHIDFWAQSTVPDAPHKQADDGYIDLRLLFNREKLDDWMHYYLQDRSDENRANTRRKIRERAPRLENLDDYRFPVLEISADTEIGDVAEIFEHMNSRGQELNKFDLMVARTYEADPDNKEKDKFNLREEWEDLYDDHPNLERVGLSVDKDGLLPLELIALQVARNRDWKGEVRGISASSVLKLDKRYVHGTSTEVEHLKNLSLTTAVEALDEAANFLISICGVVHGRLMPQKKLLLPIADQFFNANARPDFERLKNSQLRKWFFASCLSGRYYGGVNSYVEGDCKELEAWVETGVVPGHVKEFDAGFVRGLDFAKRDNIRAGSIYEKAMMALVVSSGAKDWKEDGPLMSEVAKTESVEIHHMVPEMRLKDWYSGRGADARSARNKIANLTPISSSANGGFRNDSPDSVAQRLDNSSAVFGSHHVDEQKLRAGSESPEAFDAHQASRSKMLQDMAIKELGLAD